MQRPKYIKAWPVVIPYWTTGQRTLLHQAVEGVLPNKVGVRRIVTNFPIEGCKCNLCESMDITTWISRGSEVRVWVDSDDLRHATANLLLRQGVALDPVSNILGHSQISVTLQHYSHMPRDQKRKTMETLAGLGA